MSGAPGDTIDPKPRHRRPEAGARTVPVSAPPAEGVAVHASTSRYAAKIELDRINDPHVLAVGRVPANSSVLDLGLADGSVAAVLKAMGCRSWGVEIDPSAAESARRVCEEVAVEDLNHLDLGALFEGRRFDVVLMLDVLEHLPDPAAVLRGVGSVLASGGWGVISLPNVAHVSVRLSLLSGRFAYSDVGLLDRTHLRFFDRAGVDQLLHEAGWGMLELVRVTQTLANSEIKVEGADPDLVRELESDIEGLTYQFVVCVAPLGSAAFENPPVLPAAIAQAGYRRLEGELRNLYSREIPRLETEIAVLQASVASFQTEVASFQTEVASLQTERTAMHEANLGLQNDLDGLRDSRIFRWSAPARKLFHRLGHR